MTLVLCIPRREIKIEIIVREEDIPVRGNVVATNDPEEDRKAEDEILALIAQGDEWAWASVIVRATYSGRMGEDYLGCCSYRDEADFKQPGGYYDDMRERAIEDLLNAIRVDLPRTIDVKVYNP